MCNQERFRGRPWKGLSQEYEHMPSREISRTPMGRLESGVGTGAIKRDVEEANRKTCVSSMNRCNRKRFRGSPWKDLSQE